MSFGNGADAGGVSVPLDELDRAIVQTETVQARLTSEREIIAALSYTVGDDPDAGARLAAQDHQAGLDLADADQARAELLQLRADVNQPTGGGGLMFGLGVFPAVAAGAVAVVAAVVAWVAYVWNAMDARRTERDAIRTDLVQRGLAPASILSQEEPGILAGITGGLKWAVILVGALIGLAAMGQVRA